MLERPRPDHAAVVRDSVAASLGALSFIDWGQHAFDDERALRFCAKDAELVATGEALIWFAFERQGDGPGHFVGNLDLHSFDFDVPRCQIGYVGDLRRAGRGLMREAALAVLDHAFGALRLERVEAWCDARNARSVHFARGLGFTEEGRLRRFERDPQGALCDQVVLARLRDDPPPPMR